MGRRYFPAILKVLAFLLLSLFPTVSRAQVVDPCAGTPADLECGIVMPLGDAVVNGAETMLAVVYSSVPSAISGAEGIASSEVAVAEWEAGSVASIGEDAAASVVGFAEWEAELATEYAGPMAGAVVAFANVVESQATVLAGDLAGAAEPFVSSASGFASVVVSALAGFVGYVEQILIGQIQFFTAVAESLASSVAGAAETFANSMAGEVENSAWYLLGVLEEFGSEVAQETINFALQEATGAYGVFCGSSDPVTCLNAPLTNVAAWLTGQVIPNLQQFAAQFVGATEQDLAAYQQYLSNLAAEMVSYTESLVSEVENQMEAYVLEIVNTWPAALLSDARQSYDFVGYNYDQCFVFLGKDPPANPPSFPGANANLTLH